MSRLPFKTPYFLSVLLQTYRLPRSVDSYEKQLASQQKTLIELNTSLADLRNENETLKDQLAILPSIDDKIINLQSKITKLKDIPASPSSESSVVNNTVSDNHEFDHFYKQFEDHFRGPEETIKERVSEHVPLFQSLPEKVKELPIIDLGCGRGEFLDVMLQHDMQAIGVDMNQSMVERCNELGYKAVVNDALSFLREQKNNSLAAVVGFHIVEHIPFEVLMRIFEECYRTVATGGLVLFETPNPQSLTVGANTFYLDPSHQRPIPYGLLDFMLASHGFKTEVRPLHKIKETPENIDEISAELHEAIYGFGDYAVIGRKLI